MTTPDPLRSPEWFAQQIGMGTDWVARNTRNLPHHKVGRKIRYDDHCVDAYRAQTAITPNDPMTRTTGSRNRK